MARIVTLVHEENGAFGASFPDLPGCTTVARDLDLLIGKATEVVDFHVRGMIEDGLGPPVFRPLAELREHPEFRADASDALVILLDYNPPGRTVRVNITLDEGVLRRIDHAAEAAGESRSGFLVSAAKRRLAVAG